MDIDELIQKINSAIFKVNKVLGAGFLQKVYENALLMEFRNMGLNAKAQVPINASLFYHCKRLPMKALNLMVGLLHPASLPIRHSNAGFLISTGQEIPMVTSPVLCKLPFGLTLFERI